MINSCIEHVRTDLHFQQLQLKRYQHEYAKTRHLNNYRLIVRKHADHKYYSLIDTRDPEPTTRYLGKKSRIVNTLQKRRFLFESMKRIEGNVSCMSKMLSKYQSIDPNDIRKALPEAYKFNDQDCYDAVGAINIEEWGHIKIPSAPIFPEALRHGDIKGERLRSKSEVLIANALAAHKIRYIYEKPLDIGGHTIIPDFTVISPKENREIYWEHFGLLSREDYRRSFVNKLILYSSSGIIPQRDLIMTFDDLDGNIDSRVIDQMIALVLQK